MNRKIIFTMLALVAFGGHIFCQTYVTKTDYPLDKEDEIKFYHMTEDEAKEYESDLWRRIADLALIPPKINTAPSSKYDYDQQDYVMALTNEITPKGRHWVAWIGNCDCSKAILLAAKSDDDGKTWSKPCLVIDALLPNFPVDRTVILGNFWTDPLGRLWLFFDQTMQHHDGRGGLWVTVCENPDADDPIWSAPKRIWHGGMLNKPTILSSGEWLLCTYLLQTTWWYHNDNTFSQLEPYRGVNLLASGHILLIKNGDKLNEHNGRNLFSAWLSDDDGQTWKGGLIIDDRPQVTYPDGTQGPDGTIYVTYDHNRGDGEIVMAKFTEEDILAGKIVDSRSQLKIVVCKPGKNK